MMPFVFSWQACVVTGHDFLKFLTFQFHVWGVSEFC